jgi:hypothetical protein
MVTTNVLNNMKLLLLVVLLALTGSCKKDIMIEDDKLSLQKIPYTGNQLKIDGYYYRDINHYLTVYFLYSDGTILYGSTFPANELQKHEDEYKTAEWQTIVKEYKHRWGLFKIEGNIIQFDRWYPSNPPLKAYVREGIILNDTTFRIAEYYRMQDGNKTNVETLDEIYQFKSFSPKPDSTNKFTE